MTVGKAAIKWTDELCLWESSLFLGCFYPCLSSAGGGRGKLALLLLLPPAPFACCFTKPPSAGSKRGQKHVCSMPEEQSSMWTRQQLRSAEMPSGTEPFPTQRHLPCRRSAQKGCTHCPLPAARPGHRPRHDQPLCFVWCQASAAASPHICIFHFRPQIPLYWNAGFQAGKLPISLDTSSGTAVTSGKARDSATAQCSVLCCGKMH